MNSLESRSHIGWFSLFLWGVTFWLDGFRCIYGVWRSDWMGTSHPINTANHPIRTSHPINTANNWTILECENGTRTRKFNEQYETMVFAVFMGCDVLIGWFSLYLWVATFWLDGFCCIYGVWRSDYLLKNRSWFFVCVKRSYHNHLRNTNMKWIL
jgi:hypothetical protein